jgi:hypothetical protein
MTRADWECEWAPTDKDNKLHELAKRYHDETEAYDRTVCTGPIRDGSVMPIGTRQMALVNRNAIKVRERIMHEAAQHDISRQDIARAISRHA